ncbi:MAG: DUF2723 domain-containing protein [Candidatus Coatesbacteria bacterium]|nr:MAG: DUF2723 domain-containing protein [Candidatus Coatesbacteria bacterium]
MLTVVYFIFRSRNHPVDAVLYALAVDVPGAYPLFHWHHLLHTPAGWLALHAARAFGYGGEAFAPLAAVSAVAGGGAAAALYLALRRLAVGRPEALLAAAGAAFSAAWWYFAGEAEVLSIISLFLAGALFLLVSPRLSFKTAVLVALWLGVGTLFHQALLLCTPAAVALLAKGREKRWRRLGLFAAFYVAIVAAAYLTVPYLYYGVRGVGEWYRWVTYYAQWGDWGHLSWARWGQGVVTTLAAVAAGPDPAEAGKVLTAGRFLSAYAPAVAVAASILAVIAAEMPRLWRERRLEVLVLVTWFVAFRVFFSWWEPENVEWGIATTMPMWVLFGLAAGAARGYRLGGAVIVGVLVVVNFGRVIFPATVPGRNQAEAAARAIVSATRPGDAVLVAHVDVHAWIDYVSRQTRFLPSAQPFGDPGPGAARKIEREARRGFPEYAGEGNDLYFTDFEWDNLNLVGRPEAEEVRLVFFRMVRGAEPVTVVPFPGGKRVLYRFNRYREEEIVQIYEAEELAGGIEAAVLPATDSSLAFAAVIPTSDRYVLSVQARGVPARGQYPEMELVVGEEPARRTVVDSDYWGFYEAEYELKRGETEVTIAFKNDFYDAETGENRDLFVNRVVVFRRGAVWGPRPAAD